MTGRPHANEAGMRSSRGERLLLLAALAVVVIQAMALATRYFQPWLDGDYLLPQRFAADVLTGVHPLSGWTLSSSPYFFPDFALSLLWHALLGGAPLLPFYVVTSYVALALLVGWSLRQAAMVEPDLRAGSLGAGFSPNPSGGRVPPDATPWLLGALLVNLLLACQGTADHARWLWWLGTATFHGGAVLLGLAQFALWAGPAETAPARGRVAVATLLLFLGLASDTLLLTQFVVPLGVALFLTAGPAPWRAPRVRAFLLALAAAVLLVALLRGALALADWGNFPKVVRYAPTPAAVGGAALRMLGDLTGPVVGAAPRFVLFFILGTAGAMALTLRATPPAANPPRKFVIHYMTNLRLIGAGLSAVQRQAGWFAAVSLASTLALPALAVYWQNPQHGRYLLPCLLLPLWWLVTVLPPARLRTPFVAGIVTAALLGLGVWRGTQVDFSRWTWPYPARVAELEQVLSSGGHTRGLADFWPAQYLNAVNRGGLRLNQLRPDGRVRFWGNNAFHHFETEAADAPLRAPRYTFILADGLDPVALRAKFGAPHRVVRAGGHEVWLYDTAGAERLSALVDAEVRAFLGTRPGTERIGKP